jgi:hypothetical protein
MDAAGVLDAYEIRPRTWSRVVRDTVEIAAEPFRRGDGSERAAAEQRVVESAFLRSC